MSGLSTTGAGFPFLLWPGPVRFLGGVRRGRLTVPERWESGFRT